MAGCRERGAEGADARRARPRRRVCGQGGQWPRRRGGARARIGDCGLAGTAAAGVVSALLRRSRLPGDRSGTWRRGGDRVGDVEFGTFDAAATIAGAGAMIDLEQPLRDALREQLTATGVAGDWQDVLQRAGERRRVRRRQVALLAVVAAGVLLLAATPLGAVIGRGVGGFSQWLAGTPGDPAEPNAQRAPALRFLIIRSCASCYGSICTVAASSFTASRHATSFASGSLSAASKVPVRRRRAFRVPICVARGIWCCR